MGVINSPLPDDLSTSTTVWRRWLRAGAGVLRAVLASAAEDEVADFPAGDQVVCVLENLRGNTTEYSALDTDDMRMMSLSQVALSRLVVQLKPPDAISDINSDHQSSGRQVCQSSEDGRRVKSMSFQEFDDLCLRPGAVLRSQALQEMDSSDSLSQTGSFQHFSGMLE